MLELSKTIETLRANVQTHAMDPMNPPMILPVTKMQSVDRIESLRETGLTAIGENRVQELLEKYPRLSSTFTIHLIGRLQTNKIKYIIGKVCMVQSLDRMSLAEALHAHAAAHGVRLPVLVEVNISGETQKAGVTPDMAESFICEASRLDGIQIQGLMAVMPFTDPETIRPLFRAMRVLYDRLRARAVGNVSMDVLSMGMSGDWHVAAQEGSTLLRIGSAIFGNRE